MQDAIDKANAHKNSKNEQLMVVINEKEVVITEAVQIGVSQSSESGSVIDVVYISARKSTVISRSGYGGSVFNIGRYADVKIGTNCMDEFSDVVNNKFAIAFGGTVPTITFSGDIRSNGNVAGVDAFIRNSGSLTLGENVTLEGNTLKATGTGAVNDGGAVVVTNGGTLNVRGSVFIGNSATGSGGAIYVENGSTLNFESGTIEGNRAFVSGGGILIDNSTAKITGGTITSNAANYLGGGVAVRNGGTLEITGEVEISYNRATNGSGIALFGKGSIETSSSADGKKVQIKENVAILSGGGVFAASSPETVDGKLSIVARLNLKGVDIQGNEAQKFGGGISLTTTDQNTNERNVTYDNILKDDKENRIVGVAATIGSSEDSGSVTISGNKAKYSINARLNNTSAYTSYGLGGGLYALGAEVNITNTTISANETSFEQNYTDTSGNSHHDQIGGYGGGVYASYSAISVKDSIISENIAMKNGGGFYVTEGAEVTFSNCDNATQITQNKAQYGGGIYIYSPTGRAKVQIASITMGGEGFANIAAKGDGIYVDSTRYFVALLITTTNGSATLSDNITISDHVYLAPHTNTENDFRDDAIIYVDKHCSSGASIKIALDEDQKKRGHIVARYMCDDAEKWADERMFVTDDLVSPYCFIAKGENIVVGLKIVLRENVNDGAIRFFESLESAFAYVESGNWNFVLLEDLDEMPNIDNFAVSSQIAVYEGVTATLCSGRITGDGHEWEAITEEKDGLTRKVVKMSKELTSSIFKVYGSLTTSGVIFDGAAGNAGIATVENEGSFTLGSNTLAKNFNTIAVKATVGEVKVYEATIENNTATVIQVSREATLTMTDSTIINNEISGDSVVTVASSKESKIENCVFTDNSATDGGAVLNKGKLTISGGKFANNSATNGGVVANINGGTLTITTSTSGSADETATSSDGADLMFENNSAKDNGGAIYSNSGTLTVAGVTFSDNTTKEFSGNGGTIAVVNTTVTISDTTIQKSYKLNDENSVIAKADNGGGLYAKDSIVKLNGGNTFEDNKATNGGAIYLENGSITASTSDGKDNLITKNVATNGGGLYIVANSTEDKPMNLSGLSIIFNKANNGNGGGVYVASGAIKLTGGSINDNKAVADMTESTNKLNKLSTGLGGGVYVASGATLIIEAASSEIITGNEALYGGGIYTAGITTLTSGVIRGNVATTMSSNIDSSTSSFQKGKEARGGGVFVAGKLEVVGGSISGNIADFGGGVYLDGTLVMNAGNINSNQAYWGAGLYANSREATLSGGSISYNVTLYEVEMVAETPSGVTGGDGGGVYVAEGKGFTLGTSTISSETSTMAETKTTSISNNTALRGGGVFVAGQDSEFTLQGNATLSNNTAILGGGVYVGHSIIKEIIDGKEGTPNYYPAKFVINAGTISSNTAKIPEQKDGESSNIDDVISIGKYSVPKGGGVYCEGTLEMHSATIEKNTASQEEGGLGGGLYFDNGEIQAGDKPQSGISDKRFSLTIGGDSDKNDNSTFTKNKAAHGGAIEIQSKQGVNNIKISNTTFKENTASVNGGAVDVRGSAIFSDCKFYNNSATENGGAMYVARRDTTEPNSVEIKDSIFGGYDMVNKESLGNTAAKGGAIYVFGKSDSSSDHTSNVTLLRVTMSYNGEKDKTEGGAMYIENSNVYFVKENDTDENIISHNSATNGGAIVINGGKLEISGSTKFTANNATNGGALYVSSGEVALVNGIFGGEAYQSIDNDHDLKTLINAHKEALSDKTKTDPYAPKTDISNTADKGGAIYVKGGSVTIAENVQIAGNHATSGGGVYIENGELYIKAAKPTKEENKNIPTSSNITGNYATSGGGVYVGGGTLSVGFKGDGSPNNLDSSGYIFGNIATNGGAVYISGGSANLISGSIKNNCAFTLGGGVYAGGGKLTMNNFEISENYAQSGGGICVAEAEVTVNNGGKISENSALNIGNVDNSDNFVMGVGGGISISGGTVTLNGSAINNNFAAHMGGGIYARGGAVTQPGVDDKNNKSDTLRMGGNHATNYGGAIAIPIGGGSVTLSNFIIGGIKFDTEINEKGVNDNILYAKSGSVNGRSVSGFDENQIEDIKSALSEDRAQWANYATFGGAVYVAGGIFKVAEKSSGDTSIVQGFGANTQIEGKYAGQFTVGAGNIASSGGALFVAGGEEVTLNGGNFVNNYAVGKVNDGNQGNKELKDFVDKNLYEVKAGEEDKGKNLIDYWGGGAICQVKGTLTLNGADIQNNETNGFGGAVLTFSNRWVSELNSGSNSEANSESNNSSTNFSKFTIKGGTNISNNSGAQKVQVLNNVASGTLGHVGDSKYGDGVNRLASTDGIVSVNSIVYFEGGKVSGKMTPTTEDPSKEEPDGAADSLSLYLLGTAFKKSSVTSFADDYDAGAFIEGMKLDESATNNSNAIERNKEYLKNKYKNHYIFKASDGTLPVFTNNIIIGKYDDVNTWCKTCGNTRKADCKSQNDHQATVTTTGKCDECGGSGRYEDADGETKDCPYCDGVGTRTYEKTCPYCDGTGYVTCPECASRQPYIHIDTHTNWGQLCSIQYLNNLPVDFLKDYAERHYAYGYSDGLLSWISGNATDRRKVQRPNIIISYFEIREGEDLKRNGTRINDNCEYLSHKNGTWRVFQLKAKKKPNVGLDSGSKDALGITGTFFEGFFDSLSWIDKNPALGEIASKIGGVSKIAETINALASIDYSAGLQGSLVGQSDAIAKWKEYLRTDWSGDYVDVGPLIEAIIQGVGEIIAVAYPPAKPVVDAIKYGYQLLKGGVELISKLKYVSLK